MSACRERSIPFFAKVDAPGPPEQCVVTGSIEELGHWNARSGLVLHWRGGAWVTKEPLLLSPGIDVEFKFVRLRYGFTDWEPCGNRTMQVPLSGELALEGRFGGDSMLTVLDSQSQLSAHIEDGTEPPVDPRPFDLRRCETLSSLRYEEMASELMAQHKALELRQQEQEKLLAQQALDTERLRAELQKARLESARLAQEAEQAKLAIKTGPATWGWGTSSRANSCQTREASISDGFVPATSSSEDSRTAKSCHLLAPNVSATCAPASRSLETLNKASTCQPVETNFPNTGADSVENARLSADMTVQSELREERVANAYTNDTSPLSPKLIYTPGNTTPAQCEAPAVGAVPSPCFVSSSASSSLAKVSTAASTPLSSSDCPKKTEGRPLHGDAGKGHVWNSRSSLKSPNQAGLISPMRSFRGTRTGFYRSPQVTGYGRLQAHAAPLSARTSSPAHARLQNFAYDVGLGKDAELGAEQCPEGSSDAQKTPSKEATIAALLAARGASPVIIRTPDEPCEVDEKEDWQRKAPGLLMSKEVEAAFSNARLRFSDRMHSNMSR